MKTFLTLVGGVLLVLSCVTASDARSHATQQGPSLDNCSVWGHPCEGATQVESARGLDNCMAWGHHICE
jgi:hypothetical protein